MRIKVVHLVSADGWGGLEAMVLDLLSSEVYRARIDATLVVLNEGRFASKARDKGLRVVVVPESARSFLSLIREVKRVTDDLRPDIVHTHRYKEILLGAILSRTSAPLHLVTIHGYEPPTSHLVRGRAFIINSLCIGTALLRGGRFVVVADHLRESFMIPRGRCVTINNGIKIPEPAKIEPEQKVFDRSKAPVIGWVGRMVPVKGLSTLLEAAAEMRLSPAPTLLLIGDGPERASLEQLAKSLGISARVKFQGFIDNTWPLYRQMDLFVLPSLHEGIPIALLEALGTGLPVVASAVGGIPYVIGASGGGVLIESRSPSVWAKALSELLEDRDKMRAIGECAGGYVRENFSVEGMARKYLAVYESMEAS